MEGVAAGRDETEVKSSGRAELLPTDCLQQTYGYNSNPNDATLQDANDLCEVLSGCDFTIKLHCVTCSTSLYYLFSPTSHPLAHLPSQSNSSLNEGGDGMELSGAGVWDITLVGNSHVQLFNTLKLP